jgi:hypothetical protein
MADRLERQPRRVVRKVLLVPQVDIQVVAHAQVQRQARRRAPVVLEPQRELTGVPPRVGLVANAVEGAAVGLLPLPHDAGRLEALGIQPVAVAEDHRRIVEKGDRREVLVVVQ